MPIEKPHEPGTLPEPDRKIESETLPDLRNPSTPTPDTPTTQSAGSPSLEPFMARLAAIADTGEGGDAPTAVGGLPVVPGYAVAAELARGGMGVVYAARDLALNREVAVKTLLPHLSRDTRYAAQFDREAQLTALLSHPGVPPIHATGTLPDGRPFLAMRLIRGRTLADELADRAAHRPRFLGVFEAICQTVGYAHSIGLIHRDLKPGNVMVGAFGEVQVMDWGLAKPLASGGREPGVELQAQPATTAVNSGLTPAARGPRPDIDATLQGSAKGTPSYMPPEQARGEWDTVDARADVFALGGILCVILTGQPPFSGKSAAEVVQRAAGGDLRECLARLDGCGVDAELVSLCKRCLAPDPSARPADGKAVADAVAAYRAGVEERAREAELARVRSEGERAKAEAEAREQRKRRKVQLALGLAVGLLVAAGGAFAWWNEMVQANEARLENTALKLSQVDRDRTTRNTRDAEVALARCEEALRGDRTRDAGVTLAEAEMRAAEGGTEHLAPRVVRCRADLEMLRELDRIDDLRWDVADGRIVGRERAPGAWAAAFARFGALGPDVPPATGAGAIERSLIRERLLTALDLWLVLDRSQDARALLRQLDPDPFRDSVRDALTDPDAGRLAELVGRPEVFRQPSRFGVALGAARQLPAARRQEVLRHLHGREPSDFSVLMTLGERTEAVLRTRGERTGSGSPAPLWEQIGWFRAATALRPDSRVAWNDLGAALLDSGDPGAAIAAFSKVVELDPGFAVGHGNLGVAYGEAGDRAAAVGSLRKAVELAPADSQCQWRLADELRRAGELRAAADHALAAVRLAPQDSVAHYTLGLIRTDAGDLKGAAAAYREAVRLNREFVQAHHNLGSVLDDLDDLTGALASYREAVRLLPRSPLIHNSIGGVLSRRGDLDGAGTAYREAIRLDPGYSTAHYNLAIAAWQQGDAPAAVAGLREAIRLDPKLVQAHANLGAILGSTGDVDGGIASLRECLRLNPDYPPAKRNLAALMQAKAKRDDTLAPPPRSKTP